MRLSGRKYDRHFFLAIILLQVAVVVIGFGPTYYMAGLVRAPLPSPIVHIHGAVFSMWMLLLLVQSGLFQPDELAGTASSASRVSSWRA